MGSDEPRREEKPRSGASQRRSRTTVTGGAVDSKLVLLRWLRVISVLLPILALALLGARVSALIQQIDPEAAGSGSFVSAAVVDFTSVRAAAAAIHDWSLIAAAVGALLGGWVTVAVTVRVFARFVGSRLSVGT